MQLVEGRAGNHAFDFGKAAVRADAGGRVGQAQPDTAAMAFDYVGQGTIVNDLIADCCDSSDALQGFWAYQDGPSGGARDLAARIGDPCRRINHEKEKHKGWNQEFLRRGTTVQLDHK